MSSYIYYKCGCSFSITDGEWDNIELCKKHEKEIDIEDYEVK